MSVDELLTAMFPGDPQRNLPSFFTLGLKADSLFSAELFRHLSRELANLSLTETVEINEILAALRKSDPEVTKEFIDRALVVYFTSRTVISALRDGFETLFPNLRTLPEIDYALLEPVFERGAAQRSEND